MNASHERARSLQRSRANSSTGSVRTYAKEYDYILFEAKNHQTEFCSGTLCLEERKTHIKAMGDVIDVLEGTTCPGSVEPIEIH